MSQPRHFVHAKDGNSLFVRSWGEGAPIVFLAGWTLSSQMWGYQMAPLAAQGFRCVAFDRRAHGRSGDAGGGYDFDSLADDLEAVLSSLGLSEVTLVGHSFAAGELVRHASRHGSTRVARRLFLAPTATPYLSKSPDNPHGVDPALFDANRAQLARSFPDWAEANAEPFFTPGTSRAIKDWTLGMMLQTSLQAAIELNRIQVSTDFRAELGRITQPALVIHGDRDASAPLELTGQPTAALIAGAQLVVYEGAPHGLYFTHQERLNRDIAAFARGMAVDAK